MPVQRPRPRLHAMDISTNISTKWKEKSMARQDEGRYSGASMTSRMRTAAALFSFYIAMNLGVWTLLHFLSSADVAAAVAAQTMTPCPDGDDDTTPAQASRKE